MSGVIRRCFVFQDEDTARLKCLKAWMRGASDTWVVIVAVKNLFDIAMHLLSGGSIVHRNHDGTTTVYDPFLTKPDSS